MARTRTRNPKKRRKTEICDGTRDWQEFDTNILRMILKKMDPKDVLRGASLVCRWWRRVCWDVLFWKDHETLDFTVMTDLIGDSCGYADHCDWLGKAIESVMHPLLMEDRQTLIRNIVIPPHTFLQNHHLIAISSRSPKLKRLIIPYSSNITPEAITVAAQNWRRLEEISIQLGWYGGMSAAIMTIGFFCNNITVFRINGNCNRRKCFDMDKHIAAAITKSELRLKLKIFCLKDSLLHKDAVHMVLKRCKGLQKVSFTGCCRVEDGLALPKPISAEINKCETDDGASIGWCIDSKDGMSSVEQVVGYLWSL